MTPASRAPGSDDALPGPADEPPVVGTCYGFAIHSTLPFAFLRGGHGDPLVVRARHGDPEDAAGDLIVDWPAVDDRAHIRLYRDGPRFRVWIEGCGTFAVEPEAGRIGVPDDRDALRRERWLWGLPVALCLLHRGDVPLHAAAVEIDGHAVLLAAPGGWGKTTLAAACHQAGHRILSEDLTCVRVEPGPAVIPGPAMLRPRPDVVAGLRLGGRSAAPGARRAVALDGDRGSCAPVPLRGVVFPRPGADHARVEAVRRVDALRDLWGLTFCLPTQDDRARSFARIAALAAALPAWNLYRPLTLAALPDTIAALRRLAAGET